MKQSNLAIFSSLVGVAIASLLSVSHAYAGGGSTGGADIINCGLSRVSVAEILENKSDTRQILHTPVASLYDEALGKDISLVPRLQEILLQLITEQDAEEGKVIRAALNSLQFQPVGLGTLRTVETGIHPSVWSGCIKEQFAIQTFADHTVRYEGAPGNQPDGDGSGWEFTGINDLNSLARAVFMIHEAYIRKYHDDGLTLLDSEINTRVALERVLNSAAFSKKVIALIDERIQNGDSGAFAGYRDIMGTVFDQTVSGFAWGTNPSSAKLMKRFNNVIDQLGLPCAKNKEFESAILKTKSLLTEYDDCTANLQRYCAPEGYSVQLYPIACTLTQAQ
jgi:hypothetical protein